MKAYIQLLRPLNCLMASLGVFTGAFIVTGGEIIEETNLRNAVLAALTAFLFTAAGNSLNDYYDRHIDKINHPERPIPSGKIKPRNAFILAQIFFAICIPLAIIIRFDYFHRFPSPMLIVLLSLAVMVLYELRLKKEGLSGNLCISWLTASLFLFGGASVGGYAIVLIFAALAFFSTLGREIVKDIQDIKGDIGRVTLPMKIGTRKAGYMASAAFLIAIGLSPIPVLLDYFESLYLYPVSIACAIFIYCIVIVFKKPEKASQIAKVAMLVALIAFMIGGYYK